MEQLQNNFNRITRQNPYLSSLICFNNTMFERNFTDREIEQGFDKLVEKGDYQRSMRDTLISQAMVLNNK